MARASARWPRTITCSTTAARHCAEAQPRSGHREIVSDDAALVINAPHRALLRHLPLDPSIVGPGRLQRAFGKRALAAFVLDRGVELHDVLFDLGAVRGSI